MIDKIKKIKTYRLLLDFKKNFEGLLYARYKISNRLLTELNTEVSQLADFHGLTRPTLRLTYDEHVTDIDIIFEEGFIIKSKIDRREIGI